MPAPDLDRFFRPRRMAVAGATDDDGRQSTHAWRQLSDWGRRVGAEVVPVHPTRPSVDGIETVGSLSDIDGDIDVVAILHAGPEAGVAEAAGLGVGFVIVFAAGYAETGPDGAAAEQRLVDAVGDTSTRLIGPNTNLNAFAPLDHELPGPGIAVISQSGHMGRPLYLLQEADVRITHWAPTGNEADVGATEFLRWFAGRSEVDAIALYLEGIRDGVGFLGAAGVALRAGKPVVAVKVGRTEAGADAAASHTAAVTSPDAVVDAAFDWAGVVRADDLDDLAETVVALARLPEPRTDGIAVYAMSGGACSLTADHLAAVGLPIPPFAAATQNALRDRIAGFLPVSNPVDCGGPPMADERGREILDLLAADPAVGTVVVAVSGAVPGFTDRLVDDLISAADAHPDIAFVLVWGTPHVGDDHLDRALSSPKLAVFRSARAAATALARRRRWHERRRMVLAQGHGGTEPGPTGRDAGGEAVERPVDAVSIDAWPRIDESSEWQSRRVLAEAGVEQAPAERVTDPSDASAAVQRLGGRTVLKADVAGLAHRGIHGLVEIGVTADDAIERMGALMERARGRFGDRVLGVTIATQLPEGPEVLVGAIHDPSFGPVITVGHGGSAVEDLALTAVGLAPRNRSDAGALIARVPLADRWREDDGAHDALVEVVLQLADLARRAGPRLAALEINPVRLVPGGAVALDAWLGLDPDPTEV